MIGKGGSSENTEQAWKSKRTGETFCYTTWWHGEKIKCFRESLDREDRPWMASEQRWQVVSTLILQIIFLNCIKDSSGRE